ncbi:MAG: S1/P1 nuclease [Alistipes sp.]|nr:S1/P1 nuclease [Alistipes sp.]
MRRVCTIFLVLLALPLQSFGWGRLGHRTIAEIAERHLTESAKERIMHYTGSVHLADISTWMDEVAGTEPYKYRLRGWHASIATEKCKSPVSVREEYRKGRDGVTAVEQFQQRLVQPERVKDSIVLVAIKCLVHIVGDVHCPVHVRYTDFKNGGDFQIQFYGKSTKFHAVWDAGVIQRGSGFGYKDYKKYADRLDTYTDKQITKVTKGNIQSWFEDAAKTVRPTIHDFKAGDEAGKEWVESVLPMGEELLLKSAYRLAKTLNDIFGDK